MRLIRPYRPEELSLVIQRGLASAYNQLTDRDRLVATPERMTRQFREMYRAVLSTPGSALLVAESPGLPEPGPAGHALLFPQPNPFTGVTEVVVMDIWVHPALRGRRIGSALLDEAERHARSIGAAGMVAQIFQQNQPSQALFSRAGFQLERYVTGKPL